MALPYGTTIVSAMAVTDLKASLEWFNNVLGFSTAYSVDEAGWAEVNTYLPGFTIGIQQDPERAGEQGGSMVTLSVTDIDAARRELEGKGVKFDGPVDELPGMVRLSTFPDPDGNRFMLAQSLMG